MSIEGNMKDSNALGKEVGRVHKAMCMMLKDMGEDELIITTLNDYIEQNKWKQAKELK